MRKKSLTVTLTSIAAFAGINGIASAQQTHVVEDTTSVETLAHQFATTASEIQSLNHIQSSEVQQGTSLIVPDKDVVEVKAGDTLNKIAKAHHISLEEVYDLNPGLTSLIHPGDLIAVTEKGAASLDNLSIDYAQLYATSSNEQAQNTTQLASSYNHVDTGSGVVTNRQTSYHYGSSGYEAPSRYTTSHNYNVGVTSAPVASNYNHSTVNNQGNRYYYGNCTYYAFGRRQQLGRSVGSFWGNASNWANSARNAGLAVDNRPEVGAVFQTSAGYYGHVGVVERVNSDGSFYVSEMNWNGNYNNVTNRTIKNASGYNFIH
ncbi:COG3942 and LysM peptidoglycan-binding domain-containing protein [Staphylococcus sp. Marseille-Q1834]|uniref:COG3942 and LysM peptidoglycan-binding domain-containing protein n=1 Tax=Staphylococcus sp. Marseille-Q1834 TaxID=2866594 RepID=UPI001CF825A5|nr:CHAP domain-containing protein [Staphylococcus sp. Marseille-Q1834]